MKKLISVISLVVISNLALAQLSSIDALLTKLEERKGLSKKDLGHIKIDEKKFVFFKDFKDHTERMIITTNGNQATFVEIFDDKETKETTSNLFSGDLIRNGNFISFRFDRLEGKKIPIPVTKNLLMAEQNKILYLIDVNTKQRWIDESKL